MRLEKIEIKNYKYCINTKLELQKDLTALIGINASGKTTILSAINYLKESIRRNHIYHENNDDFDKMININAVFIEKDEKIELRCEIMSSFESRYGEEIVQTLTQWRIPSITQKKWLEIPIEIIDRRYIKNLDLFQRQANHFSKIEYERTKEIVNNIDKDLLEKLQSVGDFISSISYYSATQFSDPSRYPVSLEIDERELNGRYRLLRNKGSQIQFITDLYIEKKSEKSSSFESFMNLVGMKGIGLIKDIEFHEVHFQSEEVKVKSPQKISTEVRTKAVIVPKIYVDNSILSFNQLSEGTLKTMALLFYSMKGKESLLLIEEPEVCVHHGLLSSIIEVLKSISKEKQVVISTHSDYILDQLKPDNIVIVTKDNENGIQANSLSKYLSKNDYKALHDYLSETGNLGEYWKEGGFDE